VGGSLKAVAILALGAASEIHCCSAGDKYMRKMNFVVRWTVNSSLRGFETMSVQAEELTGIAEKVLYILGVMDYSELQLTYALKAEGKWKVSFEYDHSRRAIRKIGSFAVDAESGEIEGMWLDRSWK
jgi:hypothetical protein